MAAVQRVVAIIAHHEILTRWDPIDRRVVAGLIGAAVVGDIGLAAGQGFADFEHAPLGRVMVADDALPGLVYGAAVHEDLSGPDLNPIAGQADHPFDPDLFRITRQAEDDDVAPRRRPLEQAAPPDRKVEGQGGPAPAIGVFGHDDIVAGDQAGLHRGRGNGEGLKQQNPDQARQDQGAEQDAPNFAGFIQGGGRGRWGLGHGPNKAPHSRASQPGLVRTPRPSCPDRASGRS